MKRLMISVIMAACVAGTANATKLCLGTPTVWATGISVSPTSGTINVGSSGTVTASVAPSDATNRAVSWSTSNSTVATVYGSGTNNATGTVYGNSAGSATITATTTDSTNKSATYSVTVPNPYVAVTSVSLNKSSVSLNTGGEWTSIVATVYPSNATNKTVSWGTSSSSIAYLDYGSTSSGGTQYINSGSSSGNATITAYAADSKSASCSVSVIAPTPVFSCNSDWETKPCTGRDYDGQGQNGTFYGTGCSGSGVSVSGSSKCSSKSGTFAVKGSPTNSNGQYCWCQLDGYSHWVFNYDYSDQASCSKYCAYGGNYSGCGGALVNGSSPADFNSFRKALCTP